MLLSPVTFYSAGDTVRSRAPVSFLVDALPPSPGLVFDGLPGRVEEDVSPSNATFVGNWRWWKDHESGIRFYEVALGSQPGLADMHPWTYNGLRTQAFLALPDDRQMVQAGTYYMSVRATDHANHSVTASSDGVTIDITPPVSGVVAHGMQGDPPQLFTNEATLLLLQWTGIEDPEVRPHAA